MSEQHHEHQHPHSDNGREATEPQRVGMANSTEVITIIRPSFMKFCQDGCKAAAFNHILYWIARKAKGESIEKIQAGEVYWHGTTDEITEGMANAWNDQKVRREVNSLVDMGLIGRTSNPRWKVDRTKFFFFGPEQCEIFLEICKKHAICLFGLGLCKEVLRLLACCAKAKLNLIKCSCGCHDKQCIRFSDGMIIFSDAKLNLIGTITKDSSKDNNKGEESKSVPPTSQQPAAPSPTRSSFSSEEESHQVRESAKEISEETRKDYHRRIYAGIVKRRGGQLEGKKIGFERKWVNALIEKGYTPEQVERFHRFMVEEDWRFKNVLDQKRITAKTIYDEAPTILMTLNDPNYKPPVHNGQKRPGERQQAPMKTENNLDDVAARMAAKKAARLQRELAAKGV